MVNALPLMGYINELQSALIHELHGLLAFLSVQYDEVAVADARVLAEHERHAGMRGSHELTVFVVFSAVLLHLQLV